jgi:hypothetical protein
MTSSEAGECKWCDRGWALIGVVSGLFVVAMGIDLATGGRLGDWASSLFASARPQLATVTGLPAREETTDGAG